MANNQTEKFNYEAITTCRTTIQTALNAALEALKTGATEIENGFGEGGSAMTGGSSNVISTKWAEMEKAINSFHDYLETTLNNVGTASQANQALEDMATSLFGGTTNHGE